MWKAKKGIFLKPQSNHNCFFHSAGFNEGLVCLFSGPCIGDTFSSSPSSTPVGSLESLSSHSSEQNTSSRTASSAQVKDKSLLDLCRMPSQLSNGPRSTVCVSSPESSSREDAGRTDGESEDALSLSSVSIAPKSSPAPKKAPHFRMDLRPGLLNCSPAPSLKSLHISEGRDNHQCYFKLACHSIDFVSVAVVEVSFFKKHHENVVFRTVFIFSFIIIVIIILLYVIILLLYQLIFFKDWHYSLDLTII